MVRSAGVTSAEVVAVVFCRLYLPASAPAMEMPDTLTVLPVPAAEVAKAALV